MHRVLRRSVEFVRLLATRCLVAFGAACAGLFVGYIASSVFILPRLGPGAASQNLATSIAIGLAVAAAVASLAVPVAQPVTTDVHGGDVMADQVIVLDLRDAVAPERAGSRGAISTGSAGGPMV
ncbi:MAG: hypothetical protein QOJ00_777 [Actinomycetota bacterium]|jgi:hypothetical protein